MTIKQLISVVVAVGSAWLGGSLGATALERANAAPLTGSPHTSALRTVEGRDLRQERYEEQQPGTEPRVRHVP